MADRPNKKTQPVNTTGKAHFFSLTRYIQRIQIEIQAESTLYKPPDKKKVAVLLKSLSYYYWHALMSNPFTIFFNLFLPDFEQGNQS